MNKRPLSDRDAPQIPYAADKRPESAEKAEIPELERHCGSWIILRNGSAVAETFERQVAQRAAGLGYQVQTAAQYLADLNRQIARAG